ncbi:hypothetical protein RUND412_008882 [Rhizina undulata]
MPNWHKISAHRVACLALYRAFLSHCRYLPFSNTVKKQAFYEVQQKFRKDRELQGLEKIRACLQAGYKDEELFRKAAMRDETSTSTLLEKLKEIKEYKLERKRMREGPRRPPPTRPPPVPPTRKKKLRRLAMSKSEKRTIWVRRIKRPPIMVDANGFPLLRQPGMDQSVKVSMLIKDKIKTRQKRVDLSQHLEEMMDLGKGEDLWDSIVSKLSPEARRIRLEEGVTWADGVAEAQRDVKTLMRNSELRAQELTRQFRETIQKARAKRDRREERYQEIRRQRRLKRRAERRELATILAAESKEGPTEASPPLEQT